jgi:hypothetical protein
LKDKNKVLKKLGKLVSDFFISKPQIIESKPEPTEYEQDRIIREQVINERMYSIVIEPRTHAEQLDSAEILARMELDHVVKEAPPLEEQLKETRDNLITYKSELSDDPKEQTIAESIALVELKEYMDEAVEFGDAEGGTLAEEARSLRDTLTFIGEKEYQEAAAGIALYWKALLERNPNQQILALAGVGKTFGEERDSKAKFKSDDYLLDNVLAHFSDEEVEKYKGRLITESSGITAETAKDLRVILLDDWTISGLQLQDAAGDFNMYFPQFASSVEIQLIVASDERVKYGLKKTEYASGRYNVLPVPVRAYFRAHNATYESSHKSNAHITGAHSTVDYDFRDVINHIQAATRIDSDRIDPGQRVRLQARPALAGIVRTYHAEDAELTQRERFGTKAG